MKRQLLKIIVLLTACVAGPLHAQPGNALPESVYEGLPFEMKKVEQPRFARHIVSITEFGAVPRRQDAEYRSHKTMPSPP